MEKLIAADVLTAPVNAVREVPHFRISPLLRASVAAGGLRGAHRPGPETAHRKMRALTGILCLI